nr:redoxin domain-containing protein [Actinomycetota bacterium]
IEKVARSVGNRVEFVGVDTLDQRAAALRFARRYGVSYPIAFDSSGSVAARYGVPALPMTFFLSRSGRRIVGLNVGRLTVAKLTAILKRLYGT